MGGKHNSFTPKLYHKFLAVLFALLLWQLGAMALDNQILLVTPVQVGIRLWQLVFLWDFWASVGFSLWRIALGFFLSLGVGMLLAVLSYRFTLVEIFLWPIIAAIKATPVASIIILCLIWVTGTNLSILISFLMVLPIVYTNLLTGLRGADSKLLIMSDFFKFGWLRRSLMIYMPAVKPYILSACASGLGLAWKAGISAEIIGIPTGSLGEKLYEAKIYLNTPELFAFTVTIVVVSIVFEKLILLLINRGFRIKIKFPEREYTVKPQGDVIELENIDVSFGNTRALCNFSGSFKGLTAVMGQSGCGKTTLINVIMGLTAPARGSVNGVPRDIAPMFQEDRLCKDFTATENLTAAKGVKKEKAAKALLSLGVENMERPVGEFSGGMKRRVALARAVLAPSSLVILDEPFKGLDEDTKQKATEFLLENLNGRQLILITHDEREAKSLGGEVLRLSALQCEG